MKFHYGYFVLIPNGFLRSSGDDWGPTRDTYQVGDSLGKKNGVEATVVALEKGAIAQMCGFDVAVLLIETEETEQERWVPSQEAIDNALETLAAMPEPPPTIQTPWPAMNVRMVAIWNGLHQRPPTETFHEFLIEVPLKGTFGKDWHDAEQSKLEKERHVVEQWLRTFYDEGAKHRPPDHNPGDAYEGPSIGATTELIALAHDLYLLQKVNRLPVKLVDRLRNYNEFQGARYEIAIAAAFVKCGLEIEWIEDRSARHPEFVARHKRSGEEVAVETKSRRRKGVLHHPGTVLPPEELSADVDRLYRDALMQNPGDKPFAIFIDVNLPPELKPEEPAKWQREIVGRWGDKEQEVALLGFTNFAWHHKPTEAIRATEPEFLLSVPLKSKRPLKKPATVRCLKLVLDAYGLVRCEY
jgi:hypothetical protein